LNRCALGDVEVCGTGGDSDSDSDSDSDGIIGGVTGSGALSLSLSLFPGQAPLFISAAAPTATGSVGQASGDDDGDSNGNGNSNSRDLQPGGLFYSEYYEEDELVHEGFPLEYASPRKRQHFFHTAEEIAYLEKLNGIERVKQAICEVRHLLPDDDGRIFLQVRVDGVYFMLL
jgi:hypothetical protein